MGVCSKEHGKIYFNLFFRIFGRLLGFFILRSCKCSIQIFQRRGGVGATTMNVEFEFKFKPVKNLHGLLRGDCEGRTLIHYEEGF